MNEQYIETFGVELSAPDIRDYRIAKQALRTEFPAEFELEMGSAKNQGNISSCVAHVLALIAEYHNKRQHNIDNEISVGYIYGNRQEPLNTTPGMVLRSALLVFCKEGAPFFDEFPLHCEMPKISLAVDRERPDLMEGARKNRFSAFVKVVTEEEIKTALMDIGPIVIAVPWYKGNKVKNGILYSDCKEQTSYHAMVIYGWDENGWKIQNSWSAFWGERGRAILPATYPIREMYAPIDNITEAPDIKKPFSTDNKFLKWCVKVANKAYSMFYTLVYKISNK